MSETKDGQPLSAVQAAVRAKHEPAAGRSVDLAREEAALLAEVSRFEAPLADSLAPAQHSPRIAEPETPALVFPEIIEVGIFRTIADQPVRQDTPPPAPTAKAPVVAGSSLLDSLKAQAVAQQVSVDAARAEQGEIGRQIDAALKKLFFYLHDLVQQLDVLHPVSGRRYPLIEDQIMEGLAWQEGFADYRALPQSRGGWVESVSFSYQLAREQACYVRRQAFGIERFRNILHDYGLLFYCKEVRNATREVQHADFEIPAKVSVTTRFRADFANQQIVLETRNLERFGILRYLLRPAAVDDALCDEFTRLVLGQPNQFRELSRR